MIERGGSAANARRLFFIANLSILMIGLGFAIRANIAGDIQQGLFDALDVASSGNMIGSVLGATRLGFALSLLFGSARVAPPGIARILRAAAFGVVRVR